MAALEQSIAAVRSKREGKPAKKPAAKKRGAAKAKKPAAKTTAKKKSGSRAKAKSAK